MAENLFAPNQLGTPSIVFNPMRAELDANQFKITDLSAPTSGTDAATKAYVDASVGPGGGAANWANNPAVNNVNMNGFGINSATTISASGDITASGNSLITTAGQVATNTSAIATKAPSANPTFTGTVTVPTPVNPTDAVTKAYVDANAGVNILPLNNTFTGTNAFNGSDFTVGTAATPISDTFEIHAQDVNLRAHGLTDILNLTSAAGVVVAAGGAVNITGGASSSMYAALGTVGIGGPVNHIIVDGADIEDVVNLTASGTISGNILSAPTVNGTTVNATTVTASGNVSGNNVSGTTSVSAPTVNATTVSASGNIIGNNVAATATVQGASVVATGGVQGATLSATGNITTNAGEIRTLGGSIIASGTGLGQGVIEGAVKAVAPLGDFNTVFTGEIQLGDNAGVNELTLLGNDPTSKVITAIQEGGTGTPGGVVDTRINPISADLTGSTLNIKALNGAGATTTMASVNLSGLTPDPLFTQFLSLIAPAGSTTNLTAGQMNSAIDFEVSTTGSVTVNLPNNVPPGSAIFIKLNGETSAVGANIFLTPPGVAVGSPPSVNIRPNGGCFAVAMNQKAGDTQFAISESFAYFQALNDYLPLAGGTMTGTLAVQDTTNIQAKNITTALLTPLPSVGFISALGPMQVENGNFLVANGTSTEIGLAATASPPIDQVATIKYNYAASDNLVFNKRLQAPNMTLASTDVLPTLNFKDARTFYVSKQGVDTNSGAINAPFLTIQAAVDAVIASGVECVVDVAPGVYAGFTIASVAGILLRGSLQNDRCVEGTSIQGEIIVNVTGVDNLFNNQVVIAGCFIGGRIQDISTKQHTLIVDGCRIEADSALGGEAIVVNMTSTDGRTRITSCVISQEAGTTGTNPLVSVNIGQLNMNQCELTVRAEGCCVTVSGSALLVSMNLCSLSSSSASATPNALLFLNSTSATPHNIGLSTFNYTVATSKTAPGILATRPSAGLITAVVAQCFFGLAGTLAAGNVIQYGAATALALLVAGNRSLNSAAGAYASAIQSGVSTFPLSLVGETAVNTVNNLNGAITLAGAGTVAVSQVGNTITFTGSASGGGITSINSQTGPAITVAAGTGVGVASSANTITVSNTGVLSVGVGTGLTNTGSASAPVIEFSGTGTATFQDVNAVKLVTSGTGTNFSQFGVYPRVGGSYVPPTEPLQLAPVQYVNDNKGVQSLAASGTSITVGGTAADPTVAVAASGVTAGSYTNASITLLADGRVSAASSGTAGVTSVSGTASQIASTGGTTPVISLVNTAVTPGTYTNATVVVDSTGRLTNASNGTNPSGTFLPLAGGVMSGGINMGSQAITAASAITTTALTLNSLPIAIGTNGAGATASQNLYFTNANNSPVAIASYLYPIPAAGASLPVLPAYNGENHAFPSTFIGATYTLHVNSTATTNAFSVPTGFYIHLWNRKATSITVTIASVVNPLIPVGAVNTVVVLAGNTERFIQYQGVANTWATI